MRLRIWWAKLKEAVLPPRMLEIVDMDALPNQLPRRNLIVARESGEDWYVGLACPCGCGQRIDLPLLRETTPRWKLQVDQHGRPTLSPSIWLKTGCRSHFFVRGDKIKWV